MTDRPTDEVEEIDRLTDADIEKLPELTIEKLDPLFAVCGIHKNDKKRDLQQLLAALVEGLKRNAKIRIMSMDQESRLRFIDDAAKRLSWLGTHFGKLDPLTVWVIQRALRVGLIDLLSTDALQRLLPEEKLLNRPASDEEKPNQSSEGDSEARSAQSREYAIHQHTPLIMERLLCQLADHLKLVANNERRPPRSRMWRGKFVWREYLIHNLTDVYRTKLGQEPLGENRQNFMDFCDQFFIALDLPRKGLITAVDRVLKCPSRKSLNHMNHL